MTLRAVLFEALELWGPPCVLDSDNGSEFVGGRFVEILAEKRIRQWGTKSYARSRMEKWNASGHH
jgi:hypothetical protein